MSGRDCDEIRPRLEAVFRDVFDDASLRLVDNMTAADIEGWDSLTHITLVLSVEKQFNIKLNAAEIAGLQDVGAFLRLITQRAHS